MLSCRRIILYLELRMFTVLLVVKAKGNGYIYYDKVALFMLKLCFYFCSINGKPVVKFNLVNTLPFSLDIPVRACQQLEWAVGTEMWVLGELA